MKPSRTPYNFALGPFDNAFIKYDPYGVVLILGVWNYPVNFLIQFKVAKFTYAFLLSTNR